MCNAFIFLVWFEKLMDKGNESWFIPLSIPINYNGK